MAGLGVACPAGFYVRGSEVQRRGVDLGAMHIQDGLSQESRDSAWDNTARQKHDRSPLPQEAGGQTGSRGLALPLLSFG